MLQDKVQSLQTKYDKLKTKLVASEDQAKTLTSERDVLKITLESEKSKSQITVAEREKEISSLKSIIEASKERENTLNAKVD